MIENNCSNIVNIVCGRFVFVKIIFLQRSQFKIKQNTIIFFLFNLHPYVITTHTKADVLINPRIPLYLRNGPPSHANISLTGGDVDDVDDDVSSFLFHPGRMYINGRVLGGAVFRNIVFAGNGAIRFH